MPSGQERIVLSRHADVVRSLAFTPDSRRLISTGQDRTVILWDTINGEVIRSFGEDGSNPVQFGALSPDGRLVAVGESAGTPQDITLFDMETGALRSRLTGNLMGVNALAFSPNGRTLASAGIDRTIRIWDPATGKEMTSLRDDIGWVKAISFSPDGTQLAFVGNDTSIRIWDLKSPRFLRISSTPKRLVRQAENTDKRSRVPVRT
jgi:WD40 repeat protein